MSHKYDTVVTATVTGITTKAFNDKYVKPERTAEEQRRLELDVLGDLVTQLVPFGFKKIVLTAYTPGFNDGDPCKFTLSEPYFDGLDSYLDRLEDDDEDYDEDGNEIEREDLPKYGTPEYKVLTEPRREATNIVHRLHYVLNEAFDTDWRIKITIKTPTEFEYVIESYEAGY
jgi:hypothetical protein